MSEVYLYQSKIHDFCIICRTLTFLLFQLSSEEFPKPTWSVYEMHFSQSSHNLYSNVRHSEVRCLGNDLEVYEIYSAPLSHGKKYVQLIPLCVAYYVIIKCPWHFFRNDLMKGLIVKRTNMELFTLWSMTHSHMNLDKSWWDEINPNCLCCLEQSMDQNINFSKWLWK